jgi:hypothetical protein
MSSKSPIDLTWSPPSPKSSYRKSSYRKSPHRKSPPRAKSPRRKSPRRKSPRRKSPRRKSPHRKSPRRKSPPRAKSPRRKSPRRKSPPRAKSPRRKSPRRKSPPRAKSPRRKSPPKERAVRLPKHILGFLTTPELKKNYAILHGLDPKASKKAYPYTNIPYPRNFAEFQEKTNGKLWVFEGNFYKWSGFTTKSGASLYVFKIGRRYAGKETLPSGRVVSLFLPDERKVEGLLMLRWGLSKPSVYDSDKRRHPKLHNHAQKIDMMLWREDKIYHISKMEYFYERE